jgi:metal-responsive CopG/Arc/MetJ family transcriptional regulator
MARRAKIAFSIDAKLLARVERIRLSTGESRSAVIGRALARLTSEHIHAAQAQRYREAYCEQPEGKTEVRGARLHARRTLARLPWEDT